MNKEKLEILHDLRNLARRLLAMAELYEVGDLNKEEFEKHLSSSLSSLELVHQQFQDLKE